MARTIRDSLADLGRFSEPALHILISLAAGPKHGYAMTRDIEEITGQKPGTLSAFVDQRGSTQRRRDDAPIGRKRILTSLERLGRHPTGDFGLTQ